MQHNNYAAWSNYIHSTLQRRSCSKNLHSHVLICHRPEPACARCYSYSQKGIFPKSAIVFGVIIKTGPFAGAASSEKQFLELLFDILCGDEKVILPQILCRSKKRSGPHFAALAVVHFTKMNSAKNFALTKS